ncbi:MAG: DUF6320 domain-containing protein [Roseburia sp.]|nr:DUF6320 domain-containing protein [Roseburia sp.]
MSYCVNCGVELDASLNKCPLCGTKVCNPQNMPEPDLGEAPTFPERRGEVERTGKRDSIVFVTVLTLTISVTCGLLNGLVYNSLRWSVPVIGVCLMLWIFFMAAVFSDKITVYVMLLMDAAAIGGYLYLISGLTDTGAWFDRIALPILAVVLFLTELFTLLGRRLPFSLLVGTLYSFVSIAGVCVTIEVVTDLYRADGVGLSWSAIVLTVCAIISVILIMMLMMRRLRNSISRRLYF